MKDTLRKLKTVIDVGFVGGSDAVKIREQLDEETIALNDYFFSENGLVAVKGSQHLEHSVQIMTRSQLKISWGRPISKSS